MTGLAVSSQQSGVYLRLGVAGDTCGLGLVVTIVKMAGIALNLVVFAGQRETGYVVVKDLNRI